MKEERQQLQLAHDAKKQQIRRETYHQKTIKEYEWRQSQNKKSFEFRVPSFENISLKYGERIESNFGRPNNDIRLVILKTFVE